MVADVLTHTSSYATCPSEQLSVRRGIDAGFPLQFTKPPPSKELVEAKRESTSERSLPEIHAFFEGLTLTMVECRSKIYNCFEWVNQQN